LFNRYSNKEETFPIGNAASTSNVPQGLSDEDEIAKFQQQQRQRGLMIDPETQKWVNAPQIKMDIKRPGKLDNSPELLQQKIMQMQKEVSAKNNNRPAGNAAYQERNRRISPSKEELNKLYSKDLMEQQYGGDLRRFTGGMQQFQPGGSPVTYANNPALNDIPKMTMKSSKEVGQELMMDSRNKVTEDVNTNPQQFSVDYKNKNMYDIDPEAALATANAGIRGVTGMIDRFKNKDREAKMYENLTADNLYAADPSRDAGDYDVNTGLYRPNEQGAVHTSRSAQYGGNANYSEGDVMDMTEEELEEFLANGGEVEYLNY
jgi:hypothetical protein